MKKVSILFAALALLAAPVILSAQEEQQDQQQAQDQAGQQAAQGEQPQQAETGEQGAQAAQQAAPAGQPGQPRPDLAQPFVAVTTMVGMPISAGGNDNAGTAQDAYFSSDGKLLRVVANLQNVPNVTAGNYLLAPDMLSMEADKLVFNMTEEPLQRVEGAKSAGIIPQDAVRASQLLQFNLVNQQGQNIGTIEDIVVDMQSGDVAYAAINFTGILGAGEKTFAVPYSDIWYNLDRQTVTVYSINQQALEQNPGFDRNNWPESADQGWNRVQG